MEKIFPYKDSMIKDLVEEIIPHIHKKLWDDSEHLQEFIGPKVKAFIDNLEKEISEDFT